MDHGLKRQPWLNGLGKIEEKKNGAESIASKVLKWQTQTENHHQQVSLIEGNRS